MRSVLPVLMMMVLLAALGCDQSTSDSSGSSKKGAKVENKDSSKAKKDDKKKPGKKANTKPADKKANTKPNKKADKKATDKKPDSKSTKSDTKTEAKKPAIKGRPFDGPPSTAIVGLWNIRINRDSLPDGVKNFEELDKAFRGTMKFDGKIATVNISGQADAVPYTVLRDEDYTLEVALAGESKAKFVVTFLDHDNITLKDTGRSGELLGSREIKKADK